MALSGVALLWRCGVRQRSHTVGGSSVIHGGLRGLEGGTEGRIADGWTRQSPATMGRILAAGDFLVVLAVSDTAVVGPGTFAAVDPGDDDHAQGVVDGAAAREVVSASAAALTRRRDKCSGEGRFGGPAVRVQPESLERSPLSRRTRVRIASPLRRTILIGDSEADQRAG